jgi:hypothetical protein
MHELFKSWSPDEVAECLPGVTSEDYDILWGLVHLVPGPGETPDTCFDRALAKVWRKVPEDSRQRLNRLAAAHWEDEKW